MGIFQFVLAVIVVTTVMGLTYQYMVERMKYREERRERDDAVSENAELRRRLEELEERVRVLERIVTDESATLRDRFSEL